ncbi:MAG: PIG-L family deacetylase [Candidatus Omnitrophica bacterium]|jgi:LmbE family N-acetylglucosaminyl deacetylase|nr:PIG-L family deacetylase [Candidatus Omnitrophota bacterium]
MEDKLYFTDKDRVIIFAPHPDDEILGCAGIIQECLDKKGRVYIVFFTNGDRNEIAFKLFKKKLILHPEDYVKLGELRSQESLKANKVLNIPSENLIFLGYPDYGTLNIWTKYWNTDKPFRSSRTKTTYVPYPRNLSYSKPYIGESIIPDFVKIMKKIKPTKVFLTSPWDNNCDHKAMFNFCTAAFLETKEEFLPEIYLYLIHYKKWPEPKKFASHFTLEPPIKLKNNIWVSYYLISNQINQKIKALSCFQTELIGTKNFIFSFIRKNEIFEKMKIPLLQNGKFILMQNKNSTLEILQGKEFISIKFIMKKRKIFRSRFNLEIYIFGFKEKISFSSMPKITLKVNHKKKLVVKNCNETILSHGIDCFYSRNDVILNIPKNLLGNPDYIFCGGKIKLRNLAFKLFIWQIYKL